MGEPSFCAHVSIAESEKDPRNPTGLGKVLSIGSHVYSDLDEVMARHIVPMAAQHRALRSSRVYRDAPPSMVEEVLKQELAEKPNHVPYILSPETNNVGFYRLSYILRTRPHTETVRVVPEGLLWRGKVSSARH
jgi:transcription elongation factor SPT6